MADIQDTTRPHEILIRIDDDGHPHAQVVYRRRVVVDGQVVADEPQPAQPIALEKEAEWVNQIIGPILTDALAQLEQYRGQVDTHNRVTEELRSALNERTAQLTEAVGHLQTLRDVVVASRAKR